MAFGAFRSGLDHGGPEEETFGKYHLTEARYFYRSRKASRESHTVRAFTQQSGSLESVPGAAFRFSTASPVWELNNAVATVWATVVTAHWRAGRATGSGHQVGPEDARREAGTRRLSADDLII